ncbi:MAG: hypothetical protein IT380_10055 [Myxococcales bacterium]|nr:hypothetical protein [Myxococcales bacterium]
MGGSGVVPFFPSLYLFFFNVETLKEKNEVLTPVASSLVPGLLLGWFEALPPGGRVERPRAVQLMLVTCGEEQ